MTTKAIDRCQRNGGGVGDSAPNRVICSGLPVSTRPRSR